MKRLVFHLPNGNQSGPFSCPEDIEIADHVHKLLELNPQKLGYTEFWIESPSIPYDHILVLAHPSSSDDVEEHASIEQQTVHVYVVKMKGERMSLDEIRSSLCNVFGSNAIDKESLCGYNYLQMHPTNKSKEFTTVIIFFNVLYRHKVLIL